MHHFPTEMEKMVEVLRGAEVIEFAAWYFAIRSNGTLPPFQNMNKIKREQKRAIRWITLLVYITLDKQRKIKAIKNKPLLPDTESGSH